MYLKGEQDDDRVKAAINDFSPFPELKIKKGNEDIEEQIRAVVRDELHDNTS